MTPVSFAIMAANHSPAPCWRGIQGAGSARGSAPENTGLSELTSVLVGAGLRPAPAAERTDETSAAVAAARGRVLDPPLQEHGVCRGLREQAEIASAEIASAWSSPSSLH